jgi:hypothetical protein
LGLIEHCARGYSSGGGPGKPGASQAGLVRDVLLIEACLVVRVTWPARLHRDLLVFVLVHLVPPRSGAIVFVVATSFSCWSISSRRLRLVVSAVVDLDLVLDLMYIYRTWVGGRKHVS